MDRKRQGPIPGFVSNLQAIQRVDERIASRQRYGDEIGLQLHLAR